MTTFLTVEQVIEIHDREKVCALRDRAALEGAVGQPQTTWDGVYQYPTLLEQAGVLLFGISEAQAFEDANKRTAWLSTVVFLTLNGVELNNVPAKATEKMVLNVASRNMNATDVTLWLTGRVG